MIAGDHKRGFVLVPWHRLNRCPEFADVFIGVVYRIQVMRVVAFVSPFVRLAQCQPYESRLFDSQVFTCRMEIKGIISHIPPQRESVCLNVLHECEAGVIMSREIRLRPAPHWNPAALRIQYIWMNVPIGESHDLSFELRLLMKPLQHRNVWIEALFVLVDPRIG